MVLNYYMMKYKFMQFFILEFNVIIFLNFKTAQKYK